MARDRGIENAVGAGLLGVGGGTSVGVFGTGLNGVVGYQQATARDLGFEGSQKAGVLGRGETGVSGDGTKGPGVFGRGLPGVRAESGNGPGVVAEGQTGVVATGKGGAGVLATSPVEQAAILQSRRMAQLLLVPLRIKDPTSLEKSTAGELLSTVWADEEQRGVEIASLWFCTIGGDPTQASWVKLA